MLNATYSGGSDGNVYTATCSRQLGSVSVDILQCIAAPGVGANHTWRVCVENACSSPSVSTTSYASPIITSISGMVLWGCVDEH